MRALNELSINGDIRREKGRGSVVIGEGRPAVAAASRNVAYLAAEFESFMHVEILRGIDEFLRSENYRVSLLNSNYDPIVELSNIAAIQEDGRCGVIAVLCNEARAILAELYSSIAYEPMHKLLTLPEPPTAVFLLNDCFASGALQAIVNRGLSVPGDISLIGFDDGPEARLMSVPLTTISRPFRQIGCKAAEMLSQMIAGEVLRDQSLKLPTRLIVRSSARPPRS